LPSIEETARSLHASQRVLLIRATQDDFVPRASSDALETALRASQAKVEVLTQPGGHIRGAAPQRLKPVLEASMEWMVREGLI
jgi:predicted esterase